jgi:nitroreductase
MPDILELIRERRSVRAPYDPDRPVPPDAIQQVLEAARWAPTAHNMQNFDIVVVDDPAVLKRLGDISSPPSAVFIRENFAQLSFSEEELRRKKVGILGAMFPEAWRTPGADFDKIAREGPPLFLKDSMRDCPALLVVAYDPRKRAPASEGDVLGFMSLGCAMQNMWLMAEALDIGMQILSTFAGDHVSGQVKNILGVPDTLKIAFAIRLGYPMGAFRFPRVRRDVEDFAHYNRFGQKYR